MPVSNREEEFPIKTATACQLKWQHSTVFLTTGKTSSCHRVNKDTIPLDTFDFHNTKEKLEARQRMLEGKWPGKGCEHCKNIEDAGGFSDRQLHLKHPGILPPPELETNETAINVTPRTLEIYFSNLCNLKCMYCTPSFSSSINTENAKFGQFSKDGIVIPGKISITPDHALLKEKLFTWLEHNIDKLHKILILGGEPFIQPETEKLFDFLETKKLPDLTIVAFSNLTVEHNKFKKRLSRLQKLKDDKSIEQIQIVGSIDCWGEQAAYIRNGLNLELFEKNFEFLVNETDHLLNINSVITPLTIKTMPALVKKINEWSKNRTVYWSFMKESSPQKYQHPTIFGKDMLQLGLQQSYDVFETFNDPEKINSKNYLAGIMLEMEKTAPDTEAQKQLLTYLNELDRRRNTNFRVLFPELAELLDVAAST